MPRAKIAITLDEALLARVDALVLEGTFPNRSQAIEEAMREKVTRLDGTRLARECTKLDPDFERSLADEGLSEDAREWPEY